MEVLLITLSIVTYGILINAVPPSACTANFRWDDCGKAPEPVMYYWKPGSRCEVGIWRGCLPNINMFRDEFECVSTCIFAVRALPPDWHKIKSDYEESGETTTTPEQDAEPAPEEGTTSPSEEETPTTDQDSESATEPSEMETPPHTEIPEMEPTPTVE